MRRLLPLVPLLLVTLASCVTVDPNDPNPTQHSTGPWMQPTPQLAEKIEQNAMRLPWTHGIERVELIQWFARVGEPAYDKLLEMVLDPRADVSGAALAALGATRDARLVEPLRELPWPEMKDSDVALERARTLLRLGDWSMVPHLIDGLGDERVMVRAICGQTLYEATHERFGYDANAPQEERHASIEQWRVWWAERQEDPMR